MQDFIFSLPTKLFFGPSQAQAFAKELRKLGSRAYLITGGGTVKRLGYLDGLLECLKEEGIAVDEFSGIEPNPLSETVNRAAREAEGKNYDFVLAFGGGSVLDAAKAIAALIAEDEQDIWEFVAGSPRQGKLTHALPLATVPTTAATASEITPYAVISNKAVQGKSVLAYEFMKPAASWLNPLFTLGLNETVTQDGAADILSHIFENYLLGGTDSPVADRVSEALFLTVLETLPKLLKDLQNKDHRAVLQWCATWALSGLQSGGRKPSEFVLHSIEHSMSGYRHEIAHGRGLATLYPAYFRWLWQENRGRERFIRLGQILFNSQSGGEKAGLDFIEQFERWLEVNGLLQSAADLGLPQESFEPIAKYAVKVYGDGTKLNALGPMTVADIVTVLEMTGSQRSS
ncbi:MAG: iron-containing alcohol dehydrogenase [Bdellovibrionales bacterium]|nr:iron-containing alcohol dehydrogenase [Bdellovibrionales bacterium]